MLACKGTGLLAALTEEQVEALHTYGESLGLAFQVVDDILDFTSTEEALGKPVGGDLRQGTITLPVILMREGDLANGEYAAAFESGDVDRQVRLVQESGAIDAAYVEARRLVTVALEALQVLPDGTQRRPSPTWPLRHPARPVLMADPQRERMSTRLARRDLRSGVRLRL